ncbi:MAG: PAS domain S-box protein [Gammaproteobacteria bacterium]|nr:PAS domain S-box protein [Gammaproteobacteria bacterium]
MNQPDKNRTLNSDLFLLNVAPHFPLAIIAWDTHHVIKFWNSAAEKLFGYTADEAINQKLTKILSLEKNHESALFPVINNSTNIKQTNFLSQNKQGENLHTLWQILKHNESFDDITYTTAVITDKTELTHVNEKEKLATQSFQNLREHLNDVVYEHDLEGNFTKISEAGANSIGYSQAEFLQLNVNDLIEPHFIPAIQKNIQQKINGDKKNSTYEIQIHNKNNIKMWIEITSHIIFVDKKPTSIQGIIRNIDNQKQSEFDTLQSENKFRKIFDTIDDIYYHLDVEGNIDLISPSLYKHLGYKEIELIGTKIIGLFVYPKQRNELMHIMVTNGHVNDHEIILQHKNNTHIPFSVSANILVDDNGKMSGIEGIARNIRSRKEHEKILKTNEQRFRRIFESIQDVYFRAEDNIIKFISPSCHKMLGYAPEEMIGHNAEEFYLNSDTSQLMLEKFSNDGYLADYEIDYKHKDESTVTCSLNLNAIKDDNNHITAIEGTLRDITTRKSSEKALISSEQRFRRIFESFQDTYYEADMNGNITLLSPSVIGHYGYTPEELVGKPASAVYADPQQRVGLVEALQQNGFVNDYEIMLVTKDGELKPTSCSTKLVFNESGEPVAVQGILRDIAERKKSELALRESEASFRSIFNSIPDAFIEMNIFNTIVNVSPSVTQFSYDPAALIGSNISLFFTNPNDWRNVHNMLNSDIEVKGIESTLITKDGHITPISITAYKIQDEYNHSSNIVCIIRDISARKRYESELELARDHALEATRAKSAFLANMSHELRTPLNAIIGYSEMLHDDAMENSNHEMATDLGKIHDSGKHLLSLISDILDLSKIEAGKMEICIAPVDLSQLIDEIMVTIAPLAKQNNNELSQVSTNDILTISADKIRLKQAIYNLLSNACKFTNNGKVKLEIYQEEDHGKLWNHFKVTDTGIGITDEQIPQLFSEFSQADSTTTREFGGTGLGLVISQRFCQLMGGDISVSSVYGESSTFIIKLPA